METISQIGRTRYATHMMGVMLKAITDFNPDIGGCSLNDFRIRNHIAQASLNGQCCSIGEISETLNMSKSTVSKIVTKLIEAGIVTDHADPEDGRRRCIRFTAFALVATHKWADTVEAGRQEAARNGMAGIRLHNTK